MFGWRARIGYINPGVFLYSQEWNLVLPEGVVWAIVTAGVRSLTADEFERAFDKYLWAGETLADREVDFIIMGGTPLQLTVGYEKSMQLAERIQKNTGIPTVSQLTTLTDSLTKLGAKKITLATPYVKESNEMHKKFLEQFGFDVINMKGLSLVRNVDLTKQPSYVSYQLTRAAFREAPQADAIWIGCPAWPVLANVDILEKDFGIPIVTDVTGCLWAAFNVLHIKAPIKGYGKLLEMP